MCNYKGVKYAAGIAVAFKGCMLPGIFCLIYFKDSEYGQYSRAAFIT